MKRKELSKCFFEFVKINGVTNGVFETQSSKDCCRPQNDDLFVVKTEIR